ncbi:MAG: Ig-like domain-containing protein [Methanobacteriaceae archaeon]|jgi:hypothetical protein|nr:Ig-like domain-containing protein [Methanobacteriaceae archaeon]
MKKVELQPKKIKGMGNLLKFLKKEDFSLHGCGIENSYYPPTVAGTEFPAFIIDHPILGLNLVVTAANSSIFPSDDSSGGTPTSTTISATVTTSSGVPIQNHTVYFEENNNRFATSTTNSSGIATATYSSNLHGARTINVRVLKQSGYEGKSQNISVFVKLPTNLTLSPPNMSLTFFETRDLTARLTDARNGQVIGGRNVNFYNGSALLGSATTDNNGIATLSINNPLLVQNPDTYIFNDSMMGSNPQDKYTVSGNIQLSYVTFGGRRALKLTNDGFAYLKNVTLPENFVMRYDLYRVTSDTTNNNLELRYNQQDTSNRCTVNHANSPVVALQKQKNGTWFDIDTNRITQTNGEWVSYELRVVGGRHTLTNLNTGESLSGVENDLVGGIVYFTKSTGLYYVSNIEITQIESIPPIFADDCTGTNPNDKYTVETGSALAYTTHSEYNCIRITGVTQFKLNNIFLENKNFRMKWKQYRYNSTSTNTCYLSYYGDTNHDNAYLTGHIRTAGLCQFYTIINGVNTQSGNTQPIISNAWTEFELTVIDGVHTLKNLTQEWEIIIEHNLFKSGIFRFLNEDKTTYLTDITIWELE